MEKIFGYIQRHFRRYIQRHFRKKQETHPTEIGLKIEAKVRKEDEIKRQFLPGELGAILDWQVKDKDGKITSEGMIKSHSFTRQFMDLLLVKFLDVQGTNPAQVRNTSNVLVDIMNTFNTFNTDGAIGDVTMGIIVGKGVGAPTINDYVIGTLIPHDAGVHGADTMQYGAMTYGAPSSDPTTSQFTMTRNLANATVLSILVTEIGLYVKAETGFIWVTSQTPYDYFFMTIRDLIPAGGIAVPAGQTLTVNYRPQAVV